LSPKNRWEINSPSGRASEPPRPAKILALWIANVDRTIATAKAVRTPLPKPSPRLRGLLLLALKLISRRTQLADRSEPFCRSQDFSVFFWIWRGLIFPKLTVFNSSI
jgi:hypothetical protein